MTFKDVHLPRTDPPETIAANRARRSRRQASRSWAAAPSRMKNEPEQIRKDFAYAKLAGFPLIYAAPDPAALDFIEQMVKEHDIKLAIHNHGPEDKVFPAPIDAYKRRQDPRPAAWACASTSGTRAAPAPTSCRRSSITGTACYDLHVKDLSDPKNRDGQVEVGRGVFDFPRLFRALAADRLHRPGRARVRDQGRRPAARA